MDEHERHKKDPKPNNTTTASTARNEVSLTRSSGEVRIRVPFFSIVYFSRVEPSPVKKGVRKGT